MLVTGGTRGHTLAAQVRASATVMGRCECFFVDFRRVPLLFNWAVDLLAFVVTLLGPPPFLRRMDSPGDLQFACFDLLPRDSRLRTDE